MSVNLVVNVEQVAVSKDNLFPRNVQRLKGGEDSLLDQWSGSDDGFVKDWLKRYYLSTEYQQKYFWSYILCICAKIKHLDIEIENILVTIPKRTKTRKQPDSIFANSMEIAQEQQDAILYEGFLVPPVLGEAVTEEVSNSKSSMKDVRASIEKMSKTRILSKYRVETWLINDDDQEFVYMQQKTDVDQYLEHEANMFRFAEIVRKFIIESKHLKDDSSLWPYYKNYSHKNDYKTYHTMVNRFNLTLMFGKKNVFELFESKEDETNSCFEHFSCFKFYCKKSCACFKVCCRSNIQKDAEVQVAIRHRRKYAATLLLQKWDTLRNLNILRQQLIVIFDALNTDDEKSEQRDMVDQAAQYDKNKWFEKIKEINTKLKHNIQNSSDGWQFISEYNLKDNAPIEINIKRYPFFESFCKCFLFKSVKEKRRELGMDISTSAWYSQFKQTWIGTPQWWSKKHDLILLELALKHNINHEEYIQELKGEKSFSFRMRLKDRTTYLEFEHWCAQIANILHRLKFITNIIADNLKDIQPNLVDIRIPNNPDDKHEKHGLIFSKYEKHTHLQHVKNEEESPKTVTKYNPVSQAKKMIDNDGGENEKFKQIIGPIVKSIVDEMNKTWEIPEQEEKQEIHPESIMNQGVAGLSKRKTVPQDVNEIHKQLSVTIEMPEIKYEDDGKSNTTNSAKDGVSYSHDDEDYAPTPEPSPSPEPQSDGSSDNKDMAVVDPFIARDLQVEVYEIINSFDMLKYGEHMAKFVVYQIGDFGNMDELWIILGTVMEALPFKLGLKILYDENNILRRGKTQQLEAICHHMVDGTNWTISSALRMSEYFEEIANQDEFQQEVWNKIGEKFEAIAHEAVNQIESDHLLYALLTIPLYDTKEPMSILKLALEQERISFLNNERIMDVVKHIWYHGASIDIEKPIQSNDLSFSQMLPILVFYPFRFYMSPIGYNYTLSILFFLYLIYVLFYSWYIVRGEDRRIGYIIDSTLWILNIGYVSYEFSEFSDKGREYFSVSGLMNIWDIMISVIWILLFIINVGFLQAFHLDPNDHVIITDVIDENDDIFANDMFSTTNTIDEEKHIPIFIKAYTLLFGLQLFLLSTRFLTLFQNTEYLGGLLKVVQLMFASVLKFFSVVAVTIAAFTFGFFFIYGLEVRQADDESEIPDNFWETILFTFDLFIGGGTNAESHVGAVFTVLLTLMGMLILTNLLIALMTTEYEKFQDKAQKEVSYMRIETALDLAHRDRLMPPPLNVIVYPLGLLIHILAIIFAIFCCKYCNLYARINRTTYVCLDSCYCGCNIDNCRKCHEERREARKETKDDIILQHQLYNGKYRLFTELTGLKYLWNKLNYHIKKRCQCCRKKRKRDRKPRKKYEEQPLTAYHKGCYNCIKLRVKDKTSENREETTVRGITMKEYIAKYEQLHERQLQLADIVLLKHLTVDTLFCYFCYQPFLERQVDKDLMAPFRVLLDCISCIVFLFTAYIPLVIFLLLMSMIQYLQECCGNSVKSKKSEGSYIEFDREYFPHAKQVVSLYHT